MNKNTYRDLTEEHSARALHNQLPYNANSKVVVQYGVKDVVKWLNMFQPKGGVSKAYIPKTI